MMKNKHFLLAAVFITLLAGCAANAPAEQAVLAPSNIEVCCQDASQFPFTQLNNSEELSFDINNASPASQFVEGNSYFEAFHFSELSGKVAVTVSSLMINDSVFLPNIQLLDNQFNVVKTLGLRDLQILPSDAFSRTRYVAKFQTDAELTPYLVIYTPATLLGNKVTIDHPAKVRAKELGEAMPMVIDPSYTYQLGGHLQLSVETLKPRLFRVNASKLVDNKQPMKLKIEPQSETRNYYYRSIENAVVKGDIVKALSLLDEAKALNIGS